MTNRVVAVVGHVDHGKTSVVKALTGIDTDTLKEEQKRGLTISLGFAHYTSAAGVLSLIDAPGHADFLPTTVSGLTGVDAILLVVSAVEGVQAQTREHLEVASLMGVRSAIVAITKSDLCRVDMQDARVTEIEQLLETGSFLETRIVTCSTRAPEELHALKEALDGVFDQPSQHQSLAGFYLPIDRVFSLSGAGTVVTGTLLGGQLRNDDPSILQPNNTPVTVRGLQVNGVTVETANPGDRTAVNLRGISTEVISKGDVLCEAEAFASSSRFDVVLTPALSGATPKHMESVTVLHGTGHATARVRLLEQPRRESSGSIYAQLEFAKNQVAYAGQRLILRRPASAQTLAGGRILDQVAQPVGRMKRLHINVLDAAAKGDPLAIATALVARDGGAALIDDVVRLSGLTKPQTMHALEGDFERDEQGFAIESGSLALTKASYIDHLKSRHQQHPCRPLIQANQISHAFLHTHPAVLRQAVQSLDTASLILLKPGYVALSAHDPFTAMSTEQTVAFDRIENALKAMALRPAHFADIVAAYQDGEDLVDLLIWSERAVRIYNHALKQHVLLHAAAVETACNLLAVAFPQQTAFTTSEARKALNTSRKVIVPLLEYFDHEGVTTRFENSRQLNA